MEIAAALVIAAFIAGFVIGIVSVVIIANKMFDDVADMIANEALED